MTNPETTLNNIDQNRSKQEKDHRSETHFSINRFPTKNIEVIETLYPDGDILIRLKNGVVHIFRCSQAITFQGNVAVIS